jgi:predicted DNA-binding transcriptional regulator AlpA
MRERNSSAAPAAPEAKNIAREQILLPTDRLWTVHQAAAFLGRSASWVYKAAERGELPRARGMGWGLRFVPAQVLAYANGVESRFVDVVPIQGRVGGG